MQGGCHTILANRPNSHLRLVYYVHFGLVKVGLSLRAYATGRMRIGSQHGDVEWLAGQLDRKKVSRSKLDAME